MELDAFLTQENDQDSSQLGTTVLGSSWLVAHPYAGQNSNQQEDCWDAQN